MRYMKNKSLVITTTILFFGLVVSLFSPNVNQIYSQPNMTTTTTTIAEGFKDCFLDFKSKTRDSIFTLTQNVKYLIGLACYETYKAEGVFPHQLSEEGKALNVTRAITELTKTSDLDMILKAFG